MKAKSIIEDDHADLQATWEALWELLLGYTAKASFPNRVAVLHEKFDGTDELNQRVDDWHAAAEVALTVTSGLFEGEEMAFIQVNLARQKDHPALLTCRSYSIVDLNDGIQRVNGNPWTASPSPTAIYELLAHVEAEMTRLNRLTENFGEDEEAYEP